LFGLYRRKANTFIQAPSCGIRVYDIKANRPIPLLLCISYEVIQKLCANASTAHLGRNAYPIHKQLARDPFSLKQGKDEDGANCAPASKLVFQNAK
jgi:hypothetical protein